MAAGRRMAALFTRASRPPPKLDGGGDGVGPLGLVADVEVDVAGRVAELGGHGLALLVEHVAEHHLGPLGGEQPGLGLALAPGCARHDHDLAVETPHVIPLEMCRWA